MSQSDPKPGVPAIRLAAMNLLARREHSFHELCGKLASRFPELEPAAIRPVLEQLQAEGLQSDTRCAEAFARYRSSRGIGPLKIRAELQQRRIDLICIEAALQQPGLDWETLCCAVFRRRFGGGSVRAGRQEQARWQRFLLQRGFSTDQIRRALRRMAEAGDAPGGGLPDLDEFEP